MAKDHLHACVAPPCGGDPGDQVVLVLLELFLHERDRVRVAEEDLRDPDGDLVGGEVKVCNQRLHTALVVPSVPVGPRLRAQRLVPRESIPGKLYISDLHPGNQYQGSSISATCTQGINTKDALYQIKTTILLYTAR